MYSPLTEQLVSGPGGTYSYDAAGNLTERVGGGGTWSFGYDALERLVSVRLNGTLIVRYGYDVAGPADREAGL